MVRLINDANMDFISGCVYKILHLQRRFTHIVEYNNPYIKPCIYAMWHHNQFLVHGISDKSHLSIQISNSIDGEIVARTVERWGFRVVRGSSGKKGAVESTMQMMARLKEGECIAIMVDGPKGPLHKVKNGALILAQKTGAPIIPVHWYSPQNTFITLPSWDKIRTPLGSCNILNIYGKPIYVKEDATDEEMNNLRRNVKNQLIDLEEKAHQYYKDAVKRKLWEKRN